MPDKLRILYFLYGATSATTGIAISLDPAEVWLPLACITAAIGGWTVMVEVGDHAEAA